jgi:hypothetical protein
VSSPTARALAECKRRGWICQVVEQTIPRTFIKRDFLGVIDIIAIQPAGHYEDSEGPLYTPTGFILGIQVTSGSNHAARIAKAKAEPRLTAWLSAGARFVVWSWAKQGARGKRKQWRLREEAVTQ